MLRQYPEVSVRLTDDYLTPDFSYGYYGIYYENVPNDQVLQHLENLEEHRALLKNQLRGKMNTQTNTYISAEMSAVPSEGYDKLYEYINDQLEYPQNAKAANIEGTIFVEFVVDANGNVLNPRVVETIDGQREPIRAIKNPSRVSEQERKEAIQNMEQEALKAIRATDGMWEPASMDNSAVAEEVTLPVRFHINDL